MYRAVRDSFDVSSCGIWAERPPLLGSSRAERSVASEVIRVVINNIFFCFYERYWTCWLGDRKGIRSVKTERWGAGVVICLDRDADLHMAQLMPQPLTVSCVSKIQIGFTFLVPSHPGSPGETGVCYYDEETE